MQDRLVYFFRRKNNFEDAYGEKGFDQISVIAFSLEQAKTTVKEFVIKPEEWIYSHVVNIDKTYLELES